MALARNATVYAEMQANMAWPNEIWPARAITDTPSAAMA